MEDMHWVVWEMMSVAEVGLHTSAWCRLFLAESPPSLSSLRERIWSVLFIYQMSSYNSSFIHDRHRGQCSSVFMIVEIVDRRSRVQESKGKNLTPAHLDHGWGSSRPRWVLYCVFCSIYEYACNFLLPKC